MTGHTGFKGSWLCVWLQKLGVNLTGFSLEPATEPNLFEIANVAEGMCSIIGDVRDYLGLREALENAQPEIVIHMAAQSLVRHSYKNPVNTYATNVMGTVHLLDAMRHIDGIAAAIIVTSDKCYENKESGQDFVEGDALGGRDPYSSSKSCSELVASAYRSSFYSPKFDGNQIGIASVRAGNVIGGGDWSEDRLIPDILQSFENGVPALIRNPSSVRPWQHVLDPLAGYLCLIEQLFIRGDDFASAWNFGPLEKRSYTVEWIVDTMSNSWGEKASWKFQPCESFEEARFLGIDSSKARRLLDWSNRWDLNSSLDATVSWHRAFLKGENMREVMIRQIEDFTSAK
tara:strand:+ start:1533 stop:2564 length:1032 start_codon:yes stop_codon:yes gene_type:complete